MCEPRGYDYDDVTTSSYTQRDVISIWNSDRNEGVDAPIRPCSILQYNLESHWYVFSVGLITAI